jgi:LuxR family transcriptional regulator, maltose regulon positive regulatory protein
MAGGRARAPAQRKRAAHRQSSAPALPAKVSCPQPGDAIARPRLFRALDHLTEKPITWVHAPAGAGKTTLLATYIASRSAPVLWYDVDAGDADASTLFHYVRLGANALLGEPVVLPVPRAASPEAQRVFVRRYFEALFARLPNGTFLVFDNYQDAAGLGAWNKLFRQLCGVITPRVRVIVASRIAPPPTLARFRANDDLRLLPRHSLDLDRREILTLLGSQSSSRGSKPNEAARLLSLTSGWAVAVTLLVKAPLPSSRLTPESAKVQFEDSLQSVFEFLVGEVFEGLDAATRKLLLQIALLPTFTAAMVADLTGRSDAVPALSKLHGDHLLLERHGESGFRLHDLFRMFLLHRAEVEFDPATRRALSVRGAHLLAESDQFVAAVDLLTGSKSWTELCDLVEQHAPALASQGRLATIAGTLERVPLELRDRRPCILYWHAASLLGYQGGRAQELAERAFRDFHTAGDTQGILMSWALVVQAIATAADDLHPLEHWLHTLDELALAPPTPAIAARVALSEVLAHLLCGLGSPHSVEVVNRAIDVVRRHGAPAERVLASGYASYVYAFAGRDERAQEMQRLAHELAASAADPLAKIRYLHAESQRALFRADLKAAAKAAEQGLALARDTGTEAWSFWLQGVGAMSAIARRDFASAERLLDAMTAGAATPNNLARGYQAHVRSWLVFEQGNIDAALHWMQDAFQLTERSGFRVGQVSSLIAAVIYQGACRDSAAVSRASSDLDKCLGPTPSPFFTTSADLAKIYAQLCLGGRPRDSLRAAFRQARRVGQTPFGSRVISRLVAAALEYGIEPEYTLELLRAYELKPGPEAQATGAWPWPVKIRALGPLQIEVDGRRLRFGRKAPSVPLALMKLLAAAREPLALERLSSSLWPGYGSAAPRGTLDTALYRLRKLLGYEAAIIHENGRVAFDPELCWTDMRAFDLCCDRISDLAAAQTPLDAMSVELCQETLLDLYRGPLDGGKDDAPPVARAREQFRRRFARASADIEALWLRLGEGARRDRLAEVAAARNDRLPAVAEA